MPPHDVETNMNPYSQGYKDGVEFIRKKLLEESGYAFAKHEDAAAKALRSFADSIE